MSLLTFNQITSRTYSMIGSPNDGGVTMAEIVQDVRIGLNLFKNGSRRYYTRNEGVATLVSGQQDYTFSQDIVRPTTVKVNSGSWIYPLVEVPSEDEWNRLNVIPAVTIYVPTKFFVKGRNVVSIWPAPATGTVGTLDTSFEPYVPDFYLSDVTGSANVTNGNATILAAGGGTPFSQSQIGWWFTVNDGTGGYWQQVVGFNSNSSIAIENNYNGLTNSTATFLMGAAPDVPRDYHEAFIFFAAANFYNKRKDFGAANQFMGYFNELRNMYLSAYGSKTTGVVFTKQRGEVYNIFTMPPPPGGLSG